jgi:hypothetical protein
MGADKVSKCCADAPANWEIEVGRGVGRTS